MPAAIPEERILEAVLEVWREQGYASATTAEVARRAGIGEVTLFRRFSDKATLFAAALAREAEAAAASAPGFTGDVGKDLLDLVVCYDAVLERDTAIVIDFLRSAPTTEDLRRAAPAPLIAIDQFAAVIARHQHAGNLSRGEPLTELAELLGPVLLKRLLTDAQPGVVVSRDPRPFVDRYLDGRRHGRARRHT